MKTLLVAALVIGCYNLTNCQVNPDLPVEIKWAWVNSTTLTSSKTAYNFEPAGYEGPGITSYLCRAHVIDPQGIALWVPGKQIGRICFVHHDQPQANYQIPDIPLSVTSWIPLTHTIADRRIPPKAVIGGTQWNGPAYICRGYMWNVNNGYVVPGTYSPTDHRCYIPYNGQEVRWDDDTEILAINSYGVSLGLIGDRK